ncbi:MAG: 50S ribosomal protein L19 [Planctomycetes bacterium]|nr:50S ribosomal protein L19 [Planctomycetota bacterium]
MSQQLIDKVNARYMRKDNPDFTIGDTVDVSVRIIEGDKERTQVFSGVVMGRRGSGMSEMFTVRRIVNNEGVERTFPLHSPKVSGINVTRGGKVRRAKLYYLRKRVGKSTRLKDTERHVSGVEQPAARPAAAVQSGQTGQKA